MSGVRERRRKATRQEIVDAAWEEAERVGVAGLSLREVASVVGMRPPSIYTYFDSKDAIYDAMFAQAYEALAQFSVETTESVLGLGRVEALALATERFIDFCQASPARYQLMFTRAIPGWQPSAEAYAVSVESYRHMAEVLASYGIEGQDTLDLYTAISAGLAAQQMANDPTGDRWRRLAGTAMEMLVDRLERKDGGAT